jgi:hypothetical protein
LLLLFGCASAPRDYMAGYRTTAPIRGGLVCTEVVFLPTEAQVAEECTNRGAPDKYECASDRRQYAGTAQNDPLNGHYIVTRQPRDFNDWEALYLLGHGLVHNLLGQHK